MAVSYIYYFIKQLFWIPMKLVKLTAREEVTCALIQLLRWKYCVYLYLTSPPEVPFTVSPSKPPAGRWCANTELDKRPHLWGPGSVRRLSGVHLTEWREKEVYIAVHHLIIVLTFVVLKHGTTQWKVNWNNSSGDRGPNPQMLFLTVVLQCCCLCHNPGVQFLLGFAFVLICANINVSIVVLTRGITCSCKSGVLFTKSGRCWWVCFPDPTPAGQYICANFTRM